MATNNIFIGANACAAKVNVLFANAGITAANTAIIYKIAGNTILSFMPGRSINPIQGFEIGKGYYVISLIDRDLSAYLVPPIPSGSTTIEDMSYKYWYDILGNEGPDIILDGTNGTTDLRNKTILMLTMNNEELKQVANLTANNQFTYEAVTGKFTFQVNLDSPGEISILYR